MSTSTIPAKRLEADLHSQVTRLEITEVVRQLDEGLGQKMIAFMTNTKQPQTVSTWISGTPPRQNTQTKLREILQIFQLIHSVDSVHTTRAWFLGRNPNLDYTAPVQAIADDQIDDVISAAKTFVNS